MRQTEDNAGTGLKQVWKLVGNGIRSLTVKKWKGKLLEVRL